MLQPMRIYTETFTACNFVRIPAIQHGFYTQQLHVYVYDSTGPDAQRLIPGTVRVWPHIYTVELLFNASEWDPDTGTFREYWLPPQSGVVEIHGPASLAPAPEEAPLRLTPQHQRQLATLLEHLGCDSWEVEAEEIDAIEIDGVFTSQQLQALALFFVHIRPEYPPPYDD